MGICVDRSFQKMMTSVVLYVNVCCFWKVKLIFEAAKLSAAQYKASIYGSTAENAEIGGQINYVNQDDASIEGSFNADEKWINRVSSKLIKKARRDTNNLEQVTSDLSAI